MRDGRCVDTTMGFTPLEGLVMATRSGDVDPGLLLWLLEQHRAEPGARSPRASSTSRACWASPAPPTCARCSRAAARGEPRAALALDVYVHRLRAGIAAMAAALGGLDALVFTGGWASAAPAVRSRTVAGLGFLGVALDEAANAAADGDAEIGAAGTPARTLVVESREDLEIARAVRSALRLRRPRTPVRRSAANPSRTPRGTTSSGQRALRRMPADTPSEVTPPAVAGGAADQEIDLAGEPRELVVGVAVDHLARDLHAPDGAGGIRLASSSRAVGLEPAVRQPKVSAALTRRRLDDAEHPDRGARAGGEPGGGAEGLVARPASRRSRRRCDVIAAWASVRQPPVATTIGHGAPRSRRSPTPPCTSRPMRPAVRRPGDDREGALADGDLAAGRGRSRCRGRPAPRGGRRTCGAATQSRAVSASSASARA